MRKDVPVKRPNGRTRKGDLYTADCPSRSVLDHIGTRWSSLILVILLDKTHRFSELSRRIGGVSERMLAHSLHALEADGFVLRVVYPTKPPKVEYSLTPLGCELAVHVQALTRWVEANVSRVLAPRSRGAERAEALPANKVQHVDGASA